ncbi:hypothetical protein MJN85_31645, partial [Salmonella enterica subsp. enterica serovar Anatum]|nr:hypothetical protein [Salmonella enterica subsp. enterica serovar Anatum]
EENPMLGFRGAGRYVAESFRDCFALECEAVKRVRNDMGLTNVRVEIKLRLPAIVIFTYTFIFTLTFDNIREGSAKADDHLRLNG